MVREVVLHVGMHKTGTTAIQKALEGYDDGETFYMDLGASNHSIPIVTLFSENPLEYEVYQRYGASRREVLRRKQKYQKKLHDQLSKRHGRAIISGEDMSTLGESEIKKLYDFLCRYVTEVRVVAYIREPVSFASSMLSTYIKNNEGFSIPQPEYRKRFEKFYKYFGNNKVELRLFDRARLVNADILEDFCEWLGLDAERLNPAASMANESLSLEASRVLFLFDHHTAHIRRTRITNYARARLMTDLYSFGSQKFQLCPTIIAEHIDYDDLEWLKDASGFEPLKAINAEGADSSACIANASDLLRPLDDAAIRKLERVLAGKGINSSKEIEAERKIILLYERYLNEKKWQYRISRFFLRQAKKIRKLFG